jgi:aspartate racemase
MRTIGLIGGMSWESSAEYYRLINETSKRQLGGHHTVRTLMLTVDFGEIEALQHRGEWELLGDRMAEAARQLQAGGADGIVLCTNTMHSVAAAIESAVTIPLLHIADPTGAAIRQASLTRVGLLATRFTMEAEFYRQRLASRFGLEVLVPPAADRTLVHAVIYDELCHGTVRAESRRAYERVIDAFAQQGAQAVILGCTEIMLLVDPEESSLPVFDTTRLHAEAAVDWALG